MDSRVQNRLTISRRAGEAMYDPATGITFDGLQPDGTINHNSGAESAIHGLLTMLALDARPKLAAQDRRGQTPERSGLTTVKAEAATATTGLVVTANPAWTGESEYRGGEFLRLAAGERATIDVSDSDQRRVLEPVS